MSEEVMTSSTARKEEIAPDTGQTVPRKKMLRFSLGYIVYGFMWVMPCQIASSVLLPQRFTTLGIGQPEVILTTMNSVSIVFALIANILFGVLSDNCHSRFGKRSPWILAGGIIGGIAYWCTSVATTLPGIVAGWSFVQVGINMQLAPAMAMMSDRIPESNRGRISAFYGGATMVGTSVGVIIGSQFITTPLPGFILGTICWLLTGVMTLLVLPREKSASTSEKTEKLSMASLLARFKPPTEHCRDFYLALFGRLMLMFGYYMIMQFQLYIAEKYIGLEATAAAGVVSTMSVIALVCSIVASLSSGFITDKIGKRKPPVVVSSALIAIGFFVPFVSPSITSMYVLAALSSIGYGVYIAVDQALNIDVLPNKADAGKDLGILNIANTMGQVIAPIATSAVFLATNSYSLAFPFGMAMVLIGALFIVLIKSVK